MNFFKKKYLYLLFVISINAVIEKDGYTEYGKKIKTEKNSHKSLIAECIKKNQYYFIPDESFNQSDFSDLSPFGLARYKINNWYGKNANNKKHLETICSSSNKSYVNYIRDNGNLFLSIIDKKLSVKNEWEKIFYFIYFLKLIEEGNTVKFSFEEIFNLFYNESLIFSDFSVLQDILSLLLLKKKNSYSQAENFNAKAVVALSKIFIFNPFDKIEKERLINLIMDNIHRNIATLSISQFKKDDFLMKEISTSYQELDPARSIYEKILFKDKINLDTKIIGTSRYDFYSAFSDRFQLSHRNLPTKKPVSVTKVIVVPQINNNVIRYFVLKMNDNNEISWIDLKDYVNSFSGDFLYSINILSVKELRWLMTS